MALFCEKLHVVSKYLLIVQTKFPRHLCKLHFRLQNCGLQSKQTKGDITTQILRNSTVNIEIPKRIRKQNRVIQLYCKVVFNVMKNIKCSL